MNTGEFIEKLPQDLREWAEEVLDAHGTKESQELREKPFEQTADMFVRIGIFDVIYLVREAPDLETGLEFIKEERRFVIGILDSAQEFGIDVSKLRKQFENFLWFLENPDLARRFMELMGIIGSHPSRN